MELKLKNIDKVFENIKSYPEDLKKVINNEFKAFGIGTVNDAKRLAPVNEGVLRNSIASNVEDLKVTISVNIPYAAYLEFGTKSFAQSYVSTLPPDWQTFAAEYKGKGNGNFTQFFYAILQWVIKKGFASTFSVKSNKRVKSGHQNERDAAYAIVLSILRKGIKPHPYLYPAFEKNKIELIKNLKAQLNAK